MLVLSLSIPCETTVKYLLPAFRAMIAKELISKHKFSQVKAAEKLGITQAAISQYIYEKRGGKSIHKIIKSPEIKKEAENLAEKIAEEEIDKDGVTQKICKLCNMIRT